MKNKLTATLLCFFLGGLGVHQFYLGNSGKGILYIITIGGFFGLLPLIDLIMLITKSDQEFDQKYNGGNSSVAFNGSAADELKKLYELKSAGIITQAEFDQKKRQLI